MLAEGEEPQTAADDARLTCRVIWNYRVATKTFRVPLPPSIPAQQRVFNVLARGRRMVDASLLLQSRSEELDIGYASRDLNQQTGTSAGKVFVITIPSFL